MEFSRKEAYTLLWGQIQNSKFQEIYLNLLLERFQKRDRLLNVFLVIATSSSISAWAIWKTDALEWLWALVVASSQVVLLIKPYLNYNKYIKELNDKYYLLRRINLDYEILWMKFKYEKTTTDEVFEKYSELKRLVSEKMVFSEDMIFSENDRIYQKSKAKLKDYLTIHFNLSTTKNTKDEKN